MLWRRFCKFLSIFSISVCVIFAFGFALDQLLTTKPNHPISQAIKSRLKQPEHWQTYTSQKGKFRVSIPGGYAKSSSKIISVRSQSVTLHTFQVLRKNPISYTVSYYDLKTSNHIRPHALIQEISDGGMQTLKGEELASSAKRLGSVLGREVYFHTTLKDELTAVVRQRVFLKGQRVYHLSVFTPTINSFKEESDRFMGSFEIIS